MSDHIFEKEKAKQADIARRLQSPRLFMEHYLPDMEYYDWYAPADKVLRDSGWYKRDKRQKMAALMLPPGVGKTLRYCVVEKLMEICRDRKNTRIGIISKSQGKAKNFMEAIKTNLESNEKLISDFGEFIDKSHPWNTQEIWVLGHDKKSTTPTVSNLGAGGQIESMRFTDIILDDLVDLEVTLSSAETQKMVDRFTGTYFTRLEPNGRLMVIGHRFALRDAYAQILAMNFFQDSVFMMPAIDEDGVSNFPERFTTEAFSNIQENLTKPLWAAVYQQAPMEGGNDFDLQWVMDHLTTELPFQSKIGVDPAYTTAKKNDYMGGVAGGKVDEHIVITGLMKIRTSSNFSSHIENFYDRYKCSGGTVEINNAQTLGDTLRTHGRPIEDYKATDNKIYRIGELQPKIKSGHVRFHKQVLEQNPEAWKALKEEMLFFPDGDHEHILDSLAQFVSRIDTGGISLELLD